MIISVRISGFEDPELAHIMDAAQKAGWVALEELGIPHTRTKGPGAPSFSILHTCVSVYPSIIGCFGRAGGSGVATGCSFQNVGPTLKRERN